jgi:hypothetical protein
MEYYLDKADFERSMRNLIHQEVAALNSVPGDDPGVRVDRRSYTVAYAAAMQALKDSARPDGSLWSLMAGRARRFHRIEKVPVLTVTVLLAAIAVSARYRTRN